MLYYLYEFFGDDTVFRVFKYISFRTTAATLSALFITFIIAPWFIQTLKNHQYGQTIRDDGPQTHLAKAGTPTMGGGAILFSLGLSTLLWARLDTMFTWTALAATTGFGLIGFFDDYLKVSKKNAKGLRGSYKIVAEFALGFLLMFALLTHTPLTADLAVPFLWEPLRNLPDWFYLPFGAVVIVGAANAVNLTDGADGLALGPVMTSALVYAILAYISGNMVFAGYLNMPYVAASGEMTVLCGSIFGSCLAFLWFNAHPASVFMGDVGALGLGAALGTAAVATKNELLFVIVGGIFVLEALSVILQVASFKLTGKRIFRMAPFHHSLELRGWAEQKMVVRLWIVSIILALVGLSTLKLKFNI
ncbi:MAG: phospho-N-acetylmuramoyl-pentapeptide-transferase [Myxococcales bacterium]|nr:MAG: phospho-N-acetylmuramoyl-pentapeptide-transferase [Myxococcales bacterium]